MGNAQAAGIVGQGNAIGNILPNAYNNYQSNRLLESLINGGGSGYKAPIEDHSWSG